MNDFFNKLFGKSVHANDPHHHDNPISVQDESDHAKRDQLVQMLLHALLRKHGIPVHWVELHIQVVPGKKQGLGMYLHLIVRHWDERLINHTQAFQNRLLADIRQYEPKCNEWLHGILWKLETTKSCPYTLLPEKPFWTAPAQPAAAPVPPLSTVTQPPAAPVPATAAATPAPDAMAALAAPATPAAAPVAAPAPARAKLSPAEQANLDNMFAARDQEISKKAKWNALPEFQDTEPLHDEEDAKQPPKAEKAQKR